MDNTGPGVFGIGGILGISGFGAVGAPYGTEKFFFGAGKEGVLGGVQRAVNDNEGIVPSIEGLPYDLIITVFVVAEESRLEDLLKWKKGGSIWGSTPPREMQKGRSALARD